MQHFEYDYKEIITIDEKKIPFERLIEIDATKEILEGIAKEEFNIDVETMLKKFVSETYKYNIRRNETEEDAFNRLYNEAKNDFDDGYYYDLVEWLNENHKDNVQSYFEVNYYGVCRDTLINCLDDIEIVLD